MKTAFFHLLLAACLLVHLLTAGSVFAQTSIQQTMKKFNCAKDRSGATFCQRVAPAGRYSGQEGVYTDRSEGKTCKWKCRTEGGIETCQASGTECTGMAPPHWR